MALDPHAIRALLHPYIASAELPDELILKIDEYADLLVRWNSRVNLTSIRRPEQIIERHFGESLFAGLHLRPRLPDGAEVLDYGSGPGFPGLPIQMLYPDLRITVAESHTRKVAFLREVIRVLDLRAEVWADRVENMPPARQFDAVLLRAVEKMPAVMEHAAQRARDGGWVAGLVGREIDLPGAEEFAVPGSEHRRLLLWENVPRGTFATST